MKLLIFTPITQKSPVGKVSCLLTHALLSEHHDVTIINTACSHDTHQSHVFGTPIIHWSHSAQIASLIEQTDGCIYQMDDNYRFHIGSLAWLLHYPGIVCLHHAALNRFFKKFSRKYPTQSKKIIQKWPVEAQKQSLFTHQYMPTFMNKHTPMPSWICSMATGVISLCNLNPQSILQACPGPVFELKNRASPEFPQTYANVLINMSQLSIKTLPFIQATHFIGKQLTAWGASSNLINLEHMIQSLEIFT